ncbi:unnamed protein product [Acanthosepion pharaonis]|uniref:Uncharacterized protein n=1 Tax=Acanthosepion pharaonis TaxID=158019 RepID=A0A812AQ19_ACAPH|nr:unnamed protein product [Sepia pharaonis]
MFSINYYLPYISYIPSFSVVYPVIRMFLDLLLSILQPLYSPSIITYPIFLIFLHFLLSIPFVFAVFLLVIFTIYFCLLVLLSKSSYHFTLFAFLSLLSLHSYFLGTSLLFFSFHSSTLPVCPFRFFVCFLFLYIYFSFINLFLSYLLLYPSQRNNEGRWSHIFAIVYKLTDTFDWDQTSRIDVKHSSLDGCHEDSLADAIYTSAGPSTRLPVYLGLSCVRRITLFCLLGDNHNIGDNDVDVETAPDIDIKKSEKK